jgi:hypothetical protein
MENHVLLIQLFMEKYKNTKENETILAIGIAYFFKFQRFTQKELKGAISDLASLQAHLLIASGPLSVFMDT